MTAKPYVYRLTHPVTGEFYIGSRTANKVCAELDLPKYRTSSKYVKPRFDEFERAVLMEFSSPSCAYDYEQYLINQEWGDQLMLNKSCFYKGKRFSVIGKDFSKNKNSFFGKRHSDITREKLSRNRIGSTLPEQTKKKISESLKGNQRSKGVRPTDETIEKIRIASTGRKHSEEAKRKIGESHKGKTPSKETIEKQRAKLIGYKHTDEMRKKVSESLKGNSRSLGMHWYTDGEKNITAYKCPKGFYPGRTCKPMPSRKKDKPQKIYSDAFTSPEQHADNVRQANIGLRFFNNGIITVRTRECPAGFVPGMIRKSKLNNIKLAG